MPEFTNFTCPDCEVYPVRVGNTKCIHCMELDVDEAAGRFAPACYYLR